jgi:hypothetical protein
MTRSPEGICGCRWEARALGSLPEQLEVHSEPISIGTVLVPKRRQDPAPLHPFEALFEHGAIMERQEPLRDVDDAVWVDPDEVRIVGGVVNFREREAVHDDGLPKLFVGIGGNVRGIQKPWLG